MGLRELKAERARQRILDVAQDLFIDQGFTATTMEQIAEQAEVGTTTLYRYFPSKDHLALGPFSNVIRMGDLLRERPLSEPLDEALGAAVLASLDVNLDNVDRLIAAMQIIDGNPGTRAALWDMYREGEGNLGIALAERMGSDPHNLDVMLTTRIVFGVWEFAWARWGADPSGTVAERGAEVISELGNLRLQMPVLSDSRGRVPEPATRS